MQSEAWKNKVSTHKQNILKLLNQALSINRAQRYDMKTTCDMIIVDILL